MPNQSTTDLTIYELIKRRRRQILVHSCLYYRMNENIVPDYIYDAWAQQLGRLHSDYPEIASQVEYAEAFKDFVGDSVTGFNLPISDPDIVRVAARTLKQHKDRLASIK